MSLAFSSPPRVSSLWAECNTASPLVLSKKTGRVTIKSCILFAFDGHFCPLSNIMDTKELIRYCKGNEKINGWMIKCFMCGHIHHTYPQPTVTSLSGIREVQTRFVFDEK